MAEKELEIYGEIGLLPKAGIVWRRRWGDRLTELTVEAAEVAGVEVADLDELASTNERFGDVLLEAADRVTRVADEQYRSALARVVAAAIDDARIDEAAYILSQLVRLEPLQLRLFAYRAPSLELGKYHCAMSAGGCGVSNALVASAMEGLVTGGFVKERVEPDGFGGALHEYWSPTPVGGEGTARWEMTSWGRDAYDVLFPSREG